MSPSHTECWALVLKSGGTEPTAQLTQLLRAVFHQHQFLRPLEGGAPALFLPESTSDPRVICSGPGYMRWLPAGLKEPFCTGDAMRELCPGSHLCPASSRTSPSQLLPQTSDKPL